MFEAPPVGQTDRRLPMKNSKDILKIRVLSALFGTVMEYQVYLE